MDAADGDRRQNEREVVVPTNKGQSSRRSSIQMERRGSRPSRLELLAEQPERPPNPLIRVQPAYSPPRPGAPSRRADVQRSALDRAIAGVIRFDRTGRRLSEPNECVRPAAAFALSVEEERDDAVGALEAAAVRRVRFSLDGAEDERRLRDFGNRFTVCPYDEPFGEAYEDELSDCGGDVHSPKSSNSTVPRRSCHRIVQCGKDPLFSLSFHVYGDTSESDEPPAEQMRLGFLGTPLTYGPFYEDASSDASACEHDPPSPADLTTASAKSTEIPRLCSTVSVETVSNDGASFQSAMYGEYSISLLDRPISSSGPNPNHQNFPFHHAGTSRRKRSIPNAMRNRSTQTQPPIPVHHFNTRRSLPPLPLPMPKLPNQTAQSKLLCDPRITIDSTPSIHCPSTSPSSSSSSCSSSSSSSSYASADTAIQTNIDSKTIARVDPITFITHIDHLCDDLLIRILSSLSIRDQLSIERVCTRWAHIVGHLRRGRLAIKCLGDPRDNVRARKCETRSHHIRDHEVLEFGRFDWLLLDILPRFHHVHTLNVSLFGLDRAQRRQLVHHVQTNFTQLTHLQMQSPTDGGLYRLLLSRSWACAGRLRHFILHGCCDFERFALLTNNEDELRSSTPSPDIPHIHYRLIQSFPALVALQLHCSILHLPTQFDVLRQQQPICDRLETLTLKQARLSDQPLQSLCVLCPAVRRLSVQSAGPAEMRLLAEKWSDTLNDLRIQHVSPDQLIPLLHSLKSFKRLRRLRINSSLLPHDRVALDTIVRQLIADDRLQFRLNSRKLVAAQLDKSRASLQSILVMQELNALYQLKYLDLRRIEYKLQLVSGRQLSLLLARVCALNFCADVPLFEDHFPESLCERAPADLEHPIDWPAHYAASNRQRYQRHEFQALSLQLRHDHWRLRMQQRLLHRRMRRVRREYLQQLSDSDSSSGEQVDEQERRPSVDRTGITLDRAGSPSRPSSVIARKWSVADGAFYARSSAWTSQSSLSVASDHRSFDSESESEFSPLCDFSDTSSETSRCSTPSNGDAEDASQSAPDECIANNLERELDQFESDAEEVDIVMDDDVENRAQDDAVNQLPDRSHSSAKKRRNRSNGDRHRTRRLSHEQRQLRTKSRGPLGNLNLNIDHDSSFELDPRMKSPAIEKPQTPLIHRDLSFAAKEPVDDTMKSNSGTPVAKFVRRILPTSRTRLRSLTFSYSQDNAEEILNELVRCSPDLRLVRIHDCPLPVQLLPLMAEHCPHLVRLELNPLGYVYSCKYGLARLADLPRLTELSLANMRIHDRKLAEVISGCPNLSRVYLSACKGVSGFTLLAFVQKARVAPDVRFELHVDSLADNEYRHFALLPNFAVYIDQYSFFKLNFEPFGRLFIFAPLPDRSTLSVHQWPSSTITLGQFRQLQPTNAKFRYFVKRREHQSSRWYELNDDHQPIPVIHNKIVINFSERDVLIK